MSIVIARILTGSGVRHNLTLTDQSGTAVDITSASISIAMKSAAGSTLTTKTTGASTVTISSGSAGTFYVDWAAADYTSVTAPTNLFITVTVTLSSGKIHIEEYVEPLAAIEPVAGRLAQLSAFKEYLGITTTTDDSLMASCLDRAKARIERYCNRSFATASYTEDLDGTGSDALVVKNPPITTLTSVSSLARGSDGTETATAISSSCYRYNSTSGEITLIASSPASWDGETWSGSTDGPATFRTTMPRFSDGFKNYRVVYTGGYATGSVPDDVQQACLEVATLLYRNRRINPGMGSESIGVQSYSVRTSADIDDAMDRLLGPFRMMVIQ